MSTMSILSIALTFLAILSPTIADIYITAPVATYSGVGGQSITVEWKDDGISPLLAAVGPCSIDIYTGSITQQTWLQNLGQSVDVSKASSVTTAVNAGLGPDGNYYFVRFTSLGLKDTTNPQFPHESFSAKFSMTGMTGTFNSTVLAQINNAAAAASSSTTPAVSQTSISRLTSTSTRNTASTTGTTSSSAKATTSSASATSSAGPRLGAVAGGKGLVVMGCFVGAFGVTLALML